MVSDCDVRGIRGARDVRRIGFSLDFVRPFGARVPRGALHAGSWCAPRPSAIAAEPMKIAHVDAEQGFSGGEAQVVLLIEGLRELGYEGVVVCPPRSRLNAEAQRRGFQVLPVRMANDL